MDSKSSGKKMTERLTFELPSLFSNRLYRGDFDRISDAEFEAMNTFLEQAQRYDSGKGAEPNITKLKKAIGATGKKKKNKILLLHIEAIQSFLKYKNARVIKCNKYTAHPSLRWYQAAYVYEQILAKRRYTNSDLQVLCNCLFSTKSRETQENIFALIKFVLLKKTEEAEPAYYCLPSEFIDSKILLPLQEIFPEDPSFPMGSECAQINHAYQMTVFKNDSYFKVIQSPLIGVVRKDDSKTLRSRIHVEKIASSFGWDSKLRVDLNRYELLRFCSNLIMITPLIVSFVFPDMSPAQNNELNVLLQKHLRAHLFIDDSNYIYRKKVFPTTNFEDEKPVYTIAKEYIETVWKFINTKHPKLTCSVDKFKETIKRLTASEARQKHELKKFVSRFHPRPAIALLFLIQNRSLTLKNLLLPHDDLKKTTLMTRECFEVAHQLSERRKKHLKDPAKKDQSCFDLASEILKNLISNPRTIILQAGTPIEAQNKSSRHAFYVVIECMNVAEKAFRAVIFNGGTGRLFHARDESLDDSVFEIEDYGQRYPVASEVFKAEEQKDFLTHYLYRVLSLKYEKSSEESKDKVFVREGLRSIYLSPPKKAADPRTFVFKGREGFKLEVKPSQPLKDGVIPIRTQLSDNCTVYNFKKAIQYAMGWGIREYSFFELQLRQSADEWITSTLAAEAEALVSGGGGGEGGVDLEEDAGGADAGYDSGSDSDCFESLSAPDMDLAWWRAHHPAGTATLLRDLGLLPPADKSLERGCE